MVAAGFQRPLTGTAFFRAGALGSVDDLAAAAATSTRSRSRAGGAISSTSSGRAAAARRKRAAAWLQDAQPSTWTRMASASAVSRAPSTHAAIELSSASGSDIDNASTLEIRTQLLQ